MGIKSVIARISLFLTLSMVTAVVSAAPVWHKSVIKAVYPLADGSFVLTFAIDSPDCTSGSNPKYYSVTTNQNGVNDEGRKLMYAASLTAAAAGKDVTINFDSGTSSCYINRIWVDF